MNAYHLQKNLHRVLALSFFQVFLVIMPVAVPFFQSKGLDMQEVFLLQALFAVAVLVTEVPGGYLADLFGRRNCLVLGAICTGIGHTLLGFADGFWGLAAFELFLALAHSLVSGSDLALIYDSELALKRSEEVQTRVVSRLYSAKASSEAAGAAVCTAVLFAWGFNELVWVQVVVGWLPLGLAMTLREPPRADSFSSDHADNFRLVWHTLWHSGGVLRLTFLALCIWSLTTFFAVWLIQKLWELQGIELHHFGYLWGGLTVVAALAGRWAPALEARIGPRQLLLVVGVLPVFGYLGLAELGVVGGLLVAACFFIARGLGLVTLQNALNRRVPSGMRATANSLVSFGFRGAFVVTGPFVGWFYDLWGMDATLYILAVLSVAICASLVLPLAVRARRVAAGCASG